MALPAEDIGRGQPSQTGAKNENGRRILSRHENRERNQMPNAMASRWVVDRLMRGPKTR